MNNKFIKFLIVLNGVMLPFLLGFGIYQLVKEVFPKREKIERGIIIGEELNTAKKDSVALQGLKYYSPVDIYNSSNQYLPISLLTYEEERNINKFTSTANDVSDSFLKYVNIIFLNKNYKVLHSLLDTKASILEIKPQRKTTNYNVNDIDQSVNYIGYLIAFKDSNNDGKLNSSDTHDLYISDLNGKNLKRVSDNIDIISFEYIKLNSQVFIRYTNRENIKDEHKKKRFAIYDIKLSKFLNLNSIDKELSKLEKIIIE